MYSLWQRVSITTDAHLSSSTLYTPWPGYTAREESGNETQATTLRDVGGHVVCHVTEIDEEELKRTGKKYDSGQTSRNRPE